MTLILARRGRGRQVTEFKASLIHIASFKLAGATQCNLVSKIE